MKGETWGGRCGECGGEGWRVEGEEEGGEARGGMWKERGEEGADDKGDVRREAKRLRLRENMRGVRSGDVIERGDVWRSEFQRGDMEGVEDAEVERGDMWRDVRREWEGRRRVRSRGGTRGGRGGGRSALALESASCLASSCSCFAR